MRLVKITPRSAIAECGNLDAVRLLSRIAAITLITLFIGSFFTPWTQTVPGIGRVIALDPVDRETPIRTPIDGRVVHWFVSEGDSVEPGQIIAEMADNDPDILDRLERSKEAIAGEAQSIRLAASIAELQVEALKEARDAALANTKLTVNIAEEDRDEKMQQQVAALAKLEASELNVKRQRKLNREGLVSDRDLELAELSIKTARSEVDQANAALRAAEHKVFATQSKITEVWESNQAKISKASSELEKLRASANNTLSKLTSAETKLSQQMQMTITAPRAGQILSINTREGSEYVKAGSILGLLVPDTTSRAVEIVVDGNNAPLITKGRKVRLQFEGWPAVQFVGWPSVAVGTFGGEVAFMDYSAQQDGNFRVVVVPDQDDTPWPDTIYLRQGARVRGWILLNRVSVAYEVWRELNAFPISVTSPPEKITLKKGKK